MSPVGIAAILSTFLLTAIPCLAQVAKTCMRSSHNQEDAHRILLTVNVWSTRWVPASGPEKHSMVLPGGWREIPYPEPLREPVIQRTAWLTPEGFHMTVAPVAAIRPAIRQWLTRHGIADMPDTDLHHIELGLTLEADSRPGEACRIVFKPWLRIRQPARPAVAAGLEMLPDLGRSDTPSRPPPASAPLRLNLSLHPGKDDWRFIPIPEADMRLRLRVGGHKALLAAENGAKGVGDIILSGQVNGANRYVVIGLGLSDPKPQSGQ